MDKNILYNTVSPQLLSTLQSLMQAREFASFRLVGGTSLSLQLGHRESVDIDLFTDVLYGSADFEAIDNYIRKHFDYVSTSAIKEIAMGRSYYVGTSEAESVKLDLFYTDSYIRPCLEVDKIRMATVEEIAAMKIDVVSRVGRKKDFWDIHEMMRTISITRMLDLHKEPYPYTHDRTEIIENFTRFDKADHDFDPVCLHGKIWELVKLDIAEAVKELKY